MADEKTQVPNQKPPASGSGPSNAELLKRLEAIEAQQKQIDNPPTTDTQDPTYAELSKAAEVSLFAEDRRDDESFEDYQKRAYDAAVADYDGDAEVLDARIRRLHDDVYVSYVTSDGLKHVAEYEGK